MLHFERVAAQIAETPCQPRTSKPREAHCMLMHCTPQPSPSASPAVRIRTRPAPSVSGPPCRLCRSRRCCTLHSSASCTAAWRRDATSARQAEAGKRRVRPALAPGCMRRHSEWTSPEGTSSLLPQAAPRPCLYAQATLVHVDGAPRRGCSLACGALPRRQAPGAQERALQQGAQGLVPLCGAHNQQLAHAGAAQQRRGGLSGLLAVSVHPVS